MKPANFPGRVSDRRQRALKRLQAYKGVTARTAEDIDAEIATLTARISASARAIRSKKVRGTMHRAA